jgi:hypothetical protein
MAARHRRGRRSEGIGRFVNNAPAQDREGIAVVAPIFRRFEHIAAQAHFSIFNGAAANARNRLQLESPTFIFADPYSAWLSGVFVYLVWYISLWK